MWMLKILDASFLESVCFNQYKGLKEAKGLKQKILSGTVYLLLLTYTTIH